ncbi:BrnA antitoxin family protein [soil metagenome]
MPKLLNEFEPGHGFSKEDWDEVSNNPELTDEEIAGLRPMKEARPDLYAALQAEIAKRGPTRTKEAISIRLDIDLVEKLRASGPGWQSRVNQALRDWLERTAA